MTCEVFFGGKLCRSEIPESGPALTVLIRPDNFRNMFVGEHPFPAMKHMLFLITRKDHLKMFRVLLVSILKMMVAQFASLTGIWTGIWTSG
jgi:hypothetical protein